MGYQEGNMIIHLESYSSSLDVKYYKVRLVIHVDAILDELLNNQKRGEGKVPSFAFNTVF